MKYNIGEMVFHKLTDEPLLIIGLIPGKMYKCRTLKYGIHIFDEIELEAVYLRAD